MTDKEQRAEKLWSHYNKKKSSRMRSQSCMLATRQRINNNFHSFSTRMIPRSLSPLLETPQENFVDWKKWQENKKNLFESLKLLPVEKARKWDDIESEFSWIFLVISISSSKTHTQIWMMIAFMQEDERILPWQKKKEATWKIAMENVAAAKTQQKKIWDKMKN